MLRSVLAGLLVLASVSACGKTATPTAQPGAIAGNVVEVTGDVSVIRAGTTAPAPLAQGATVAGDDEIVTGADGRVAIVLAHNHARWDVKPGTRKKVSDSAAWSLAKVDLPPEVVDHATSAAGRDQEKAGADTGATATTEAAPAATPPPPASPTASPTAPMVEAAAAQAPAASQEAPPRATQRRAPAPEPTDGERAAETARDDVQAVHVESEKKLGAKAAKGDAATQGLLQRDAPGGGGGSATIKGAVAPQVAELTACIEPKSSHRLEITVKHGVHSFVLDGKSTAKTRACIGKIVTALHVAGDGSTELTLTRD